MQPKILIGCPTSDVKAYCLNQYIEGIRNLAHDSFDILLVDNSSGDDYFQRIKAAGIPVVKGKFFSGAKDRIVFARNLLRQKVLDDYDYFFSLEQDVVPPRDVIETLLSHNKEIVSGIYFNIVHGKLDPLIYKKIDEKTIREATDGNFGVEDVEKVLSQKNLDLTHFRIPFTFEEVEEPRLLEVGFCGLGCVLIKREVLEKIEFRADETSFDDMFFSIDARKNGFKIFADTNQKCKHHITGTDWSKIEK